MKTLVRRFEAPDGGSKGLRWCQKAPSARLDYQRDWSIDLNLAEGEVITASAWIVHDNAWAPILLPGPADLRVSGALGSSFTDTRVVVWLEGGEVGRNYLVTNRVTTSRKRTEDKSFQVRIVRK